MILTFPFPRKIPVPFFLIVVSVSFVVSVQAVDPGNPGNPDTLAATASVSDVSSASAGAQPDSIIEGIGKVYGDKSLQTGGRRRRSGIDTSADEGGMLDTSGIVWVVVLVLVIAACGWMLRRFLGGKIHVPRGEIHVVASCPLSQRSRLFVVQVGKERFLVGEGGGNVSFLSRLSPAPPLSEIPTIAEDHPTEQEDPSFADRIREWEQSVSGQNVPGEVKTSLRLLETLARRLRRSPGSERSGEERL